MFASIKVGKPHIKATVSKKIEIMRTSIYDWLKHSTGIIGVSKTGAAKTKTLKQADHSIIEDEMVT